MANFIETAGLRIAKELFCLVRDEIAPGTGIDPQNRGVRSLILLSREQHTRHGVVIKNFARGREGVKSLLMTFDLRLGTE